MKRRQRIEEWLNRHRTCKMFLYFWTIWSPALVLRHLLQVPWNVIASAYAALAAWEYAIK